MGDYRLIFWAWKKGPMQRSHNMNKRHAVVATRYWPGLHGPWLLS